jgi:hypothetical protein
MLIRNHLLCPYSDCLANERSKELRIKLLVNQVDDNIREVQLEKSTVEGKRRTSLPYNGKKEVCTKTCPYCNSQIEIVIDETGPTRYVHTRKTM